MVVQLQQSDNVMMHRRVSPTRAHSCRFPAVLEGFPQFSRCRWYWCHALQRDTFPLTKLLLAVGPGIISSGPSQALSTKRETKGHHQARARAKPSAECKGVSLWCPVDAEGKGGSGLNLPKMKSSVTRLSPCRLCRLFRCRARDG